MVLLGVALAACSGSSPKPEATAVPATFAAYEQWWTAARTPDQARTASGMRTAEQSAVRAHASDLAALIQRSYQAPSHSINLSATEAINSYCHRQGWPFGTVDHPLCDKLSAAVKGVGGMTKFEQQMDDAVRFAAPRGSGKPFYDQVSAITASCLGRPLPAPPSTKP